MTLAALKSFLTRPSHLWLAAAIVLGLLLRLPLITGSFWLDEAAQALESTRPANQQLAIVNDFQPPLFHLLVHALTYISHREWWLRLASLVPGILSLCLTYALAVKYTSKKNALMATLLLSTSQFHVYYSQELRPYSLSVFWALLCLYALSPKKFTPRHQALFIISATFGLYTVYTFIFFLVAVISVKYFSIKNGKKSLLRSIVAIALLYTPWLPAFFNQLQTGTNITQSLPSWGQAVSPPAIKAILLVIPKFIFGRIDLPQQFIAQIPFMLFVIFILIYVIAGYKSSKYTKPLISVFLLSFTLTALTTFVIPVLDPKRILFLLPLFYILLNAINALPKIKTVLVSLLLVINVSTLVAYWSSPDLQREPWRQAVADIEAKIPGNTTLVFPWNAPYAPWVWYTQKNYPTLTFATLPITPSADALQKLAQLNTPVLTFDYLADITDSQKLIATTLDQSGHKTLRFWQYPGIGKIALHSRQPTFALFSPFRIKNHEARIMKHEL